MCLLWMANNLLTVSHCRNFWLFIPESNFGRLLLPSMLFGRSASFLIFFHLLLLFRMLVFFSSHTFPLFGTLAQSFCRFSIFVYMYWNRIEESNNTKKKRILYGVALKRPIQTHFTLQREKERHDLTLAASFHTQRRASYRGSNPSPGVFQWLDWLLIQHAHRFFRWWPYQQHELLMMMMMVSRIINSSSALTYFTVHVITHSSKITHHFN